jgi:protein SCO1/2
MLLLPLNLHRVPIWLLFVSLLAAAGQPARAAVETDVTALPAPEIPDVSVIDQDGHARRFRSELVEGQRVAIQFIFTSCATICKPLSAVFSQLQGELGDRSDVRLISISIDPETDTPERMQAHAQRFHAGPRWTLVTGSRPEIDQLLTAFGVVGPKANHTAMVTVGNFATGHWTRVYGLAPSEKLLAALDSVGQ